MSCDAGTLVANSEALPELLPLRRRCPAADDAGEAGDPTAGEARGRGTRGPGDQGAGRPGGRGQGGQGAGGPGPGGQGGWAGGPPRRGAGRRASPGRRWPPSQTAPARLAGGSTTASAWHRVRPQAKSVTSLATTRCDSLRCDRCCDGARVRSSGACLDEVSAPAHARPPLPRGNQGRIHWRFRKGGR